MSINNKTKKNEEGFIAINKLEKGKCYLCGERCEDDAVLHYQCALSYGEIKRAWISKNKNKCWVCGNKYNPKV